MEEFSSIVSIQRFKCDTFGLLSLFSVTLFQSSLSSVFLQAVWEKEWEKNQCQKQDWASKHLHNEETRERNGANICGMRLRARERK